MQAGSGGHIGRSEKQLGFNLQASGERLKLYGDIGLSMSNAYHLKHVWCKVYFNLLQQNQSCSKFLKFGILFKILMLHNSKPH